MRFKFLIIFIILSSTVKSQIVNIESYRLKNDTSKIFGNFDGSLSANKNQKTILQLGFNANIEYNNKRNSIMFISIYNWVKTIDGGVKNNFINDGFQHVRYNYTITDKLKFESYAQYQYNRIMNLRERDLFGIGLRYNLNKTDIKAYAGTSIMIERDLIDDTLNSTVKYIKSSNYLSCGIFVGKHMRISNTTYFQFNINNSKYRVYTVLESTINVYKKIYYKINFLLQYDNDHIYNSPTFIYSTNNRISISF